MLNTNLTTFDMLRRFGLRGSLVCCVGIMALAVACGTRDASDVDVGPTDTGSDSSGDTSDTGTDTDDVAVDAAVEVVDGCFSDMNCGAGEVCISGVCIGPACTDGRANGNETGIDCGGPDCDPCEDGDDCLVPDDCRSLSCIAQTCASTSCTDGVQNGDEVGVDCGASCPLGCVPVLDEICDNGLDDDDDGAIDCDDDDCDDDDACRPCVPTAEFCDGIDNDCDGTIDNGVCTGECPEDMATVDNQGTVFCIDRWEASRPDATDVSVGIDGSLSTSRAGVLPWGGAGFDVASAACAAAGRRLCDDIEWTASCSSSNGVDRGYPYGGDYDATTCNGGAIAPLDQATTTGFFSDCVSATGTFDMSGNLEEWLVNRKSRGGSYNDNEFNLRCDRPNGEDPMPVEDPGQDVGFRCCLTP